MITFFVSVIALITGYFLYGKFAERIFKPDKARITPAISCADGVDYVAMPTWKVFLIQLLNIAGTGPIFGALMGAVFGPIVFLWIVLGCIFGGAVHDYFTGMISCRMDGATIVSIVGKYLGKPMKYIIRVFSLVLLILVGTVFVTSPAILLAELTPSSLNTLFWVIVILIYYILATLLPIDKIIGRFYPVFGVLLVITILSVVIALFVKGYYIPELTLRNLHPEGLPPWPFMFITVACGAVSGFHATQSPIMARCIKNETDGRRTFYGAMIVEGLIALLWAAVGVSFYSSSGELNNALSTMGQSGVVYDISTSLLGSVGGVLAIIGVVVCPVTSGDTAFRSARLTIAEWFHMDQKKLTQRLLLTMPLMIISAVLTQLDFDILWRYSACVNQSMAAVMLWSIAVYLVRERKMPNFLIALIPALFMTAVCGTYILMADEGFRLSAVVAYPIGAGIAAICGGLFFWRVLLHKKQ